MQSYTPGNNGRKKNNHRYAHIIEDRETDSKCHVDDSNNDGHLHLIGVKERQVVISHSPDLKITPIVYIFTVRHDVHKNNHHHPGCRHNPGLLFHARYTAISP